jgi:outer membrane protein OmpA-like peptidoglycan-associated protein
MKHVVYLLLTIVVLNTTIYAEPVIVKHGGGNDSTLILIPFEYKQSALFHQFTYTVIDSVVNMLLKNDSITLTIRGYAHQDEGSDTICKYLSLNRALFVRDYILGRGIKEGRIILVEGMGKARSLNSNVDKDGHALNCRAELILNFPLPPPPVVIADRDEDGIPDADDSCPDVYGYNDNHGCKDSNAIIIPFAIEQSWLAPSTFKVLDSVISLLKQNPTVTLVIQGHSYKTEGTNSVCEKLAVERANNVKQYLLSRYIGESRIVALKNFGVNRPFNTGKNARDIALNARAEIFLYKVN